MTRDASPDALRESEERFRMLADNMSQLAWTCDLLGNVTWYNKRWLEYTGLSFEEMKGWGWSKVQHPDHLERVVEHVRQSGKTGEPWEDTFPLLGRDGQYRWFLSRAVPICDAHGIIVQWFGTNTDVTQQVLAEAEVGRQTDELRALNARLQELDRIKTEFFANVSHEFRTPLTLMLGPLEDVLTRRVAPGDDALSLVHRNCVRLLKLVNSLLDFSRIESGRIEASYEPVDLAVITADVASMFRAAVEKSGLDLRVDCASLSQSAFVDRDMWEKIVLNLLSNAFKFTFVGDIRLSLREVGGAAQLTVRDTGVGIDEREVSRVFDRFHRIEGVRSRTHEGTGIGLALVHEFVKLHRGRVDVSSVLGAGTAFIVTIPLGTAHLPADRIGVKTQSTSRSAAYVQEAEQWSRTPASGRDALQGFENSDERPHILVADDNSDMREYLARVLGSRWSVEAVSDGEQALEAIRRRRPALVVTDVMMPGLDGFGVLRTLRVDPTTRTIPLVMLSARAGEESRAEGLEADADDYLVKPFSSRELLACVATRLEPRRAARAAV